jgi:hypothetical protein
MIIKKHIFLVLEFHLCTRYHTEVNGFTTKLNLILGLICCLLDEQCYEINYSNTVFQ